MNLDKVLSTLLKERKLSAQQLASNVGISASTIKAWKVGNKPRNMDDVLLVAKYFDVPFEYLIFGAVSSNTTAPDSSRIDALTTRVSDLESLVSVLIARIDKLTETPKHHKVTTSLKNFHDCENNEEEAVSLEIPRTAAGIEQFNLYGK